MAGATAGRQDAILGALENMGGGASGSGDVINVTLSVDTNAYADGDVLADFQEVTNFVRAIGGKAIIQSITVLDKADQGIAFDLFTSSASVVLGTENAAPSISDTDAERVQRICRIETSDFIDLGGCRVATRTGIGLVVEADAASRSMWIGAIIRGIGTYAADSIILRFGLVWF